MENVAGIILARMDSRRFAGKALVSLDGKTMLERTISAVLRSNSFMPILATSSRKIDQPLADYAKKNGIPCFRGELDDVYNRVCECLKAFDVDIFARINGDSPFIQADLLDSGLDLMRREGCDFVTNLMPRHFPYGVSVEILRSETFLQAESLLQNPEHHEHITSYFYQNLRKLKYAALLRENDISDVRLTIDTLEDFAFVERMLAQNPCLFESTLENIVSLYRKTLLTL